MSSVVLRFFWVCCAPVTVGSSPTYSVHILIRSKQNISHDGHLRHGVVEAIIANELTYFDYNTYCTKNANYEKKAHAYKQQKRLNKKILQAHAAHSFAPVAPS